MTPLAAIVTMVLGAPIAGAREWLYRAIDALQSSRRVSAFVAAAMVWLLVMVICTIVRRTAQSRALHHSRSTSPR